MSSKEVKLMDTNEVFAIINERLKLSDPMGASLDSCISVTELLSILSNAPTIDPESLRPHGKWELETHWFYRDTFDESKELVVYITASCSECSCKHPNNYEVFSKTLYEPEDADDDFLFDEEKEVSNALDEFELKQHIFVSYCPNCGATMEG